MPSLETFERFIACVESNAHVEAIEAFYAETASMQENQAPPRVGRTVLAEREAAVMARARSVSSHCVRPAFLNGDFTAVRWVFEFEWADGSRTRMEEIAHQRWVGEQIQEETFFYDPAQRTPQKP